MKRRPELSIDNGGRHGEISGMMIEERDCLSLDGGRGDVALGRRKIVSELPMAELSEIDIWPRMHDASRSACALQFEVELHLSMYDSSTI
jgi:hypothetical protein